MAKKWKAVRDARVAGEIRSAGTAAAIGLAGTAVAAAAAAAIGAVVAAGMAGGSCPGSCHSGRSKLSGLHGTCSRYIFTIIQATYCQTVMV